MKKILSIFLLMLLINVKAHAFATIITTIKGGDEIKFTSNQTGVAVLLNGNKIGNLNGIFVYKLQRDGEDKTFEFTKAGYKPSKVVVTTKLDPIFFGNVIYGGSIGSSVDSLTTKNSRKYTPDQIFVELVKK